MNRTKFVTVVVFLLTGMIILVNPVKVGAQNCFPVKIWDRDRIEPLNLSVNTGDCVVWINFPQSPMGRGVDYGKSSSEVLISFIEPKECAIDEITTSTGFKMKEANSCFEAGWLRPGETSSLVFKKPGTYKYDIQFRFGKELRGKTEGTVTVK
jgi:hypothetical protein